MLRNREVKLYFGFVTALLAVVVLVCAYINPYLGIFVFCAALLAGVATWAFQRWRYRRIAALADEIDRVLAGDVSCQVGENQEGEISILIR